MLNMDAITALSYIFEGTLHDNLRKIIPLHQIIQSASIQQEIGVVKNAAESKTLVPFKNFSNLIRRSLIANPFQVGQTMKRGTLLPLPFNSTSEGSVRGREEEIRLLDPTHEQRSGRVLCNSNFADES